MVWCLALVEVTSGLSEDVSITDDPDLVLLRKLVCINLPYC